MFWNSINEDNTMESGEDPEEGASVAASRPLLQDHALTQTKLSSPPPVGHSVGVAAGRLEQDNDHSNEGTHGRRRQIPTMVLIVLPMVVLVAVLFLAAAFLPPSPKPEGEQPKTPPPGNATGSSEGGDGPQPEGTPGREARDEPAVPTLLSVRDHVGGGPVSVRGHPLYARLRRAVFHHEAEGVDRARGALESDKGEIGFGDALTLAWSRVDGGGGRPDAVDDEDALALYCPAWESDARRFRDAATLAQARATHAHHAGGGEGAGGDVWSIPSFPVVREKSCEFRLYAHSVVDGGGRGGDDPEHHYSLVAATGPIYLTSNQDPTGIHVGLTGKASEMFIQFVTGDSGQSLVEIAKKRDIHRDEGVRALMGEDSGIRWTTLKGSSTSYTASDMCEEPATSTEPGFFVSPGYLHTVRATGLEPNTEYVYRPGLGFGQGIKWSDNYHVFRSSPPVGTSPLSPGKPALTFLALASQGCVDSKYETVPEASPASAPTMDTNLVKSTIEAQIKANPAQVTDLIKSMIDEQAIHSIHHIGDLSYADGAAHVWDAWLDAIQPYASRVPVMVGVGNHEYDHDAGGDGGKDPSGVATASGFRPNWGDGGFRKTGGECGVPLSKRFAVPEGGNGVFWYSYGQSLVHTIVLSSEHNMTIGSPQYTWLEKDLAAVNRTITPWIIVEMHRPMYNSELFDWLGPMISEGLQNEIEDLLLAHHVDLVLSGHYHSYFRSCDGLYSQECDRGGPTYITVGTGGAPLSNATSTVPNDYTEHFDGERWGVGRVSVFNASALHWEFVAVGCNLTDQVWLTRDRGGC